MNILFIGNSHTYFNDMPALFQRVCTQNRETVRVAMLAHGGKGLDFHAAEPEARFNICCGEYDVVVLQHIAHPFGEEEAFFAAAKTLDGWIRQSGARTVLYMTWSEKNNPEGQARMTDAYKRLGEELGALVAPVGTAWQAHRAAYPETELYFSDGEHASPEGSLLAAYTLFGTIFGRKPVCPPEEASLCEEAWKAQP